MTHRRFLLAYAAALPAAFWLAHVALGGPGVLASGIAAVLILAARFDNHTGSCLLITIVLLVVLAMILSLLMLSVAMGSRG